MSRTIHHVIGVTSDNDPALNRIRHKAAERFGPAVSCCVVSNTESSFRSFFIVDCEHGVNYPAAAINAQSREHFLREVQSEKDIDCFEVSYGPELEPEIVDWPEYRLVADLQDRHDLVLVDTSQDVRAILRDLGVHPRAYGALFVKVENGDYAEVYGIESNIPYTFRSITKLV